MSSSLYLAVMVGVIVVVTAISVPSLFWKKCSACGARNGLDARVCKQCHAPFPDEPAH